MEKPEVESIEGLSPSISIDQRTISSNPRSTVGTVTEIYDLMRLFFARVGTPHCPRCSRKVSSQTPDQIVRRIFGSSSRKKVKILSPVVKGRKGEYHTLFERLRKKGYLRFRVDGVLREAEEKISLEKTKKHNVEVLVDEVKISSDSEKRLREAVNQALEMGKGDLLARDEEGRDSFYSLNLLCPYCEISLPQLEPRTFSFNSPYGACPSCHGIGFETVLDQWGEIKLTGEICSYCGGSRLRKESLAVKIGSRNIYELSSLPVGHLISELASLDFSSNQELIVSKILKEVDSRLKIMVELGIPYLQLTRTSASLSGGEARRVRLAAQVGARLRGILYALAEPTIGRHQRDNKRLISLLRNIRDEGNSIIVVEHDEQTIRSADFILDLGPGAGEGGGHKVAEGSLDRILASSCSLPSLYLTGEKFIAIPSER